MNLDRGDAEVIIEAHDIREILANKEERDMLEAHNPDLLIAYQNLVKYAD
jgi:hypothetical protein